MYTNVLVAVDLEHAEGGEHLIRLARRLADPGGKVTLLNVIQPLPSYISVQAPASVVEGHRKASEERLAKLAEGAGGVDTIVTGVGAPAAQILDEARRVGADAIVVGSHRPDFGDFLLGSTAARVVRHAPCTVVVDRAGVSP